MRRQSPGRYEPDRRRGSTHGTHSDTERFSSERGEISLTWEPLGDVFMVEMPKDKSATGQHEMFSLFVNASGVRVSINSRGVAGRPFPRDVAGKASSTAFLAFSETWVRR